MNIGIMRYRYSSLLSLVIAVLLLVPMPEDIEEPFFPNMDKLVHVGLFFVLTLVLYWETHRLSTTQRFAGLIMIAWPVLLGGLLELVQQYCTTYRTGTSGDWLADLLGVIIAWIGTWFYTRFIRR
ncbi:MAG: VanZ family protein [Paludibacteraceae bacterium]|nr:VanZ family protein [Paludibacteraceae bacterium]